MKKSGYVGIDVSKGYADIIMLQSNKEVAEEAFRLYDSFEGYGQLSGLIDQWMVKGFETIYCGVESTGGYENNWVDYLQKVGKNKPVYVARLNPKGVKSLGEAGLTRTITDSVSAKNIALYLISFAEKVHYLNPTLTSKAYSTGRKHDSFIRMLKKQKNQLGNQLEKILYQEFSPLMCYCRRGVPVWLLLLLQKYPSVALMKKAGIKKLSSIKGISNDKAEALMKKINSINTTASDHLSSIVKNTSGQILHLDKSIDEQKGDLIKRFRHEPEVQLLTSIIGVAEQSAVEFMIEIEDVNRFKSSKKISAYFGTHPMWKQSGDGTWGNHMSKKGRAEIRAVLFMCCLSAIRHDPAFKAIYSRCRAQGKNHYNAMGVVMNKMLRIIFGILKTKTIYNREVDLKNQQNAKIKQQQREEKNVEIKKETQTKLERYAGKEVESMPVSHRYAKKKRRSPKLQIEECTGLSAS